MIEAPPRVYVPAGKRPLRRYASQSAVQQPTKSPKFPAPGGTCAHFDRVVMLDELLSDRREYCASTTTGAP
jgi:hypothetical protein